MSKVQLYEYEKAKKKDKAAGILGIVMATLVVIPMALGVVKLFILILVGLWTSGLGWASVLLMLIIGVSGLVYWLIRDSREILERAEREGVIDE